jgi:enolase
LEFQEFQLIPSTALKFKNSLEMAVTVYNTLKSVLDYRNAGVSVSDEGGFTPNLLTNSDALDVLVEALSQKKIKLGVDAFIGLDIASSQFAQGSQYPLKDKPTPLAADSYISFLKEISQKYNVLVLEDALIEEDYAGWKKLNEAIGANTYIAGDDFTAGNKERLNRAINEKACSAVIVKYNQVATVSQILEFVNVAQEGGIKTIFSQRLGETNDDIIADFAVGIQANFVKFGAPVRGERVSKYNRLLEIENNLKLS